MAFVDDIRRRWSEANTLVCVGLDPEPAKFPALLREAKRITRPGGRIVIADCVPVQDELKRPSDAMAKNSDAIRLSRGMPRPLAYIQPSENWASASPRCAASQ